MTLISIEVERSYTVTDKRNGTVLGVYQAPTAGFAVLDCYREHAGVEPEWLEATACQPETD